MSRQFGLIAAIVLVPASVAAHWLAPDNQLLTFVLASAAVIPLAGQIGRATEVLAHRLGAGIGGLLNATFGNAAELIISGFALSRGLTPLVKASLTGSIVSNVLLVFGASALAGGMRQSVVSFNRTAAGLGTTMLLLSVIALVVPAVFHQVSGGDTIRTELTFETEIAVVLLLTYALYLWFTLRTHRSLYVGSGDEHAGHQPGESVRSALVRLVAATVAVAVVSEILVGAVETAATAMGATQLFVGVVIVAIIGNAAEHYSAVVLGWRGNMDAALQIAVGSSTQMALFVAPLLVLLSYIIAPAPMDLLFRPFEVVAIALSVLSIMFIVHDGETHWMEGVLLIAVYVILAMGFYFLPGCV